MVVDSGSPPLVLSPAAHQRLGLEVVGRTRLPSLGNTTITAENLAPLTVTLGGREISCAAPIATSLDEPAALFGRKFDGIIGHELFQQYVSTSTTLTRS